uniref:Uncharacterized protein n=1 Tax=viral metagenome TaxID=1070528 RepID=A0A6M3LTT3_9ZZZZ
MFRLLLQPEAIRVDLLQTPGGLAYLHDPPSLEFDAFTQVGFENALDILPIYESSSLLGLRIEWLQVFGDYPIYFTSLRPEGDCPAFASAYQGVQCRGLSALLGETRLQEMVGIDVDGLTGSGFESE